MPRVSHNAMVSASVVISIHVAALMWTLSCLRAVSWRILLQDLYSESPQTSFSFYCEYYRISGGKSSKKLQCNKLQIYVEANVNKTI